jgi:hypothetical protein
MKKTVILFLMAIGSIISSCDKDDPKPDPENGGGNNGNTHLDNTDFSGGQIMSNKLSDKDLELRNFNDANGESIQQVTGTPLGHNWLMVFTKLPEGNYKISPFSSDRVLEIDNNSTVNGAKVHLQDFANTDNQKWTVFSDITGKFHMIKNVQNGKVMQITGASKDDGALVEVSDAVGNDNQLFAFFIALNPPIKPKP